MKQKTKIVKRKVQPKKDEKIDWDNLNWANIGGIKTTVVHETVYEPIPKSFLDKIFSGAHEDTKKYF